MIDESATEPSLNAIESEGSITPAIAPVPIDASIMAPLQAMIQTMSARIATQVAAEGKKINANVDAARIEIVALSTRVSSLEGWRLRHDSDRVRALATEAATGTISSADLKVQSQLADEIAARHSLAAKVEAQRVTLVEQGSTLKELDAKQDTQLGILRRLDAFSRHPTVLRVAGAVATAFLTWLAMRQAPPPVVAPQVSPALIAPSVR